jgi:hypothetical protein
LLIQILLIHCCETKIFLMRAQEWFFTDSMWIGLSMRSILTNPIYLPKMETCLWILFSSLSTGYEFLLANHIDVKFFPYATKMFVTSNYMQQGRYNRLDVGASILFEKCFWGNCRNKSCKNGFNNQLLTSVNLLRIAIQSFTIGSLMI